jgi:hypothetical protein
MRCVSVKTKYSFFFLNIPIVVCTSPWWRTVVLLDIEDARSNCPSPGESDAGEYNVSDSSSPST